MEDLLQLYEKIVFPILQAGAMVAVTLALRWIGAKYKINFSQAHETQIERFVLQGIAYAEEYTARNLKAGVTVAPGRKLDKALGFVNKHAPKLDRDKVRDYIEAQLAQTKGVGATGEWTVK